MLGTFSCCSPSAIFPKLTIQLFPRNNFTGLCYSTVFTTVNMASNDKESKIDTDTNDRGLTMMKLLVNGPPRLKQKPNILPVDLLKDVTQLVRRQNVAPEGSICLDDHSFTSHTYSGKSLKQENLNTNGGSGATKIVSEMTCSLTKYNTNEHSASGSLNTLLEAETGHTDVSKSLVEKDTTESKTADEPLLQMGTTFLENTYDKEKMPDPVYDLSLLFSECVPKENSEKEKKPRVNYFVAIPITNEKIKSPLQAIQDSMVTAEEQLKSAIVKVSTLHLTIMVLTLSTEEEMKSAREAMDKCWEKLRPWFSQGPLFFDMVGLGNFKNEVLFAKIKDDDQISKLQKIAEIVEDTFHQHEVVPGDDKAFKPHATIAKLSKMKGKGRKRLKKIDTSLYTEWLETDFGREEVTTLQLCSMTKPKDKQGKSSFETKYSDSGNGADNSGTGEELLGNDIIRINADEPCDIDSATSVDREENDLVNQDEGSEDSISETDSNRVCSSVVDANRSCMKKTNLMLDNVDKS
ncbi:AKA7G-like protein [Mya arenaria]|uniref:AKA7G-like protein n=1 Tax=Mya arenaria TaxID=6604 RepID=A0ABY7FMI7_MYAAR|nr:AKA7G-like protein [Mya arenaria]